MTFKRSFLTSTLFAVLSLTNAHALSQEAQNIIGKTAVAYLKKNPEAFAEIIQSVQDHARKEQETHQALKIEQHQEALFTTNDGTPFIGNKTGTIEVVVFMDPFCHYCRKFETILREAVQANHNLKIIARDIAIMHEKSLLLIQANIAAANQGKYAEMQQMLHTVDPSVGMADILKIAQGLNLDMAQFKTDIIHKETERRIKKNMDLADELNIAATPTFIIKKSKKMISGFVPLEGFQELIKP